MAKMNWTPEQQHCIRMLRLQVEELFPRIDVYEMLYVAFHFLNGYVFVVLGSIGAHFEP